MPSFEPDDPELLGFLHEYGFVVVKVLSREECEATVRSFWQFVREDAVRRGKTEWPVPEDPRTWEDGNWPAKGKFLFADDAVTQEAFDNRTHPRLHRAFSQIFGTEQLLSKIDKWGAMRGTVHSEELFPERGGFRSDWRWELLPHFDCNPHQSCAEVQRGLPRMYQGMLALVDCFDSHLGTTGGFRCVPRSAMHLGKWCAANAPQPERHSVYPSKGDPWFDRLQRIPLRCGEACIFDTGTLHANFDNFSNEMRIVQFVRMIDPRRGADLDHRSKHFPQNRDVPPDVQLTEVGKKLLGRKKWK